MKKLLLVTLISSFIVACGGGSGGSANAEKPTPTESKEQIELRLNLPPEPSEEENNATILGVNTNPNENLVRDDIERKIGFTFPNDEMARKVYNRQAELWTLMVENQADKVKTYQLFDEYWLNLGCKSSKYVPYFEAMNNLGDYIRNTPERYMEMINIKKFINYAYPTKSKSETKQYCEGFK